MSKEIFSIEVEDGADPVIKMDISADTLINVFSTLSVQNKDFYDTLQFATTAADAYMAMKGMTHDE